MQNHNNPLPTPPKTKQVLQAGCNGNALLLARSQNVKCSDLCGLSLLLKLLELLGRDKTDRFVPCNQLRASRHGGQDDVPAQAAKTEGTHYSRYFINKRRN